MIYDLLQNSEMFSSQTLSTLQIILCDDTILGVWRGPPKVWFTTHKSFHRRDDCCEAKYSGAFQRNQIWVGSTHFITDLDK